ncbi:MAG: methionyl-tRNA formyltransferase [Lachnospiraceae bacterium]|nr:methionyl-tRNA formyltransferase [Lachnospiraceae bacterium]
MKIVFMGTPDFSVGTLEAIVAAGHEVQAVITQPDKPKGRGKAMQMTPVKEAALAHGLLVWQPQKLKSSGIEDELLKLQPDVIVVVAFGQIIPKSILEIPKYGCINVHASLLPKYRGAAPIQWAVIDGEEKSGVTIMRMDEGLDTGDMLAKTEIVLAEEETGGSLFEKLSQAGARLLVESLTKLADGSLTGEKQPENSPNAYARMIRKSDGSIDWEKPAVVIERLVRGMNPWPSAYTKAEGKTLKLWKTRIVKEDVVKAAAEVVDSPETAACGTVVAQDKQFLYVKTGEEYLRLEEVQLEGKKRMPCEAFLRGFQVETGLLFTQD